MDMHPRELKQLVRDLPTLPTVYQQLFAMMRDSDVKVSDVAEYISRDQALTTKILRVVNSSYYGQSAQVGTISRAVIILGFQAVRSAAMSMSVFEHFKGLEHDGEFSLVGFWHHSVAAACLARCLSESQRRVNADDAYVAGLLHDMGKLVMLRYFPADVDSLTEGATENRLTWAACEDALFPTNHAAIARAVFRAWNFPDPIIEATACHHAPQRASRHAELAAIAHVSDVLAFHAGHPSPGAEPVTEFAPEAIKLLGLSKDYLSQVLAKGEGEIEKSAEILNLLD